MCLFWKFISPGGTLPTVFATLAYAFSRETQDMGMSCVFLEQQKISNAGLQDVTGASFGNTSLLSQYPRALLEALRHACIGLDGMERRGCRQMLQSWWLSSTSRSGSTGA